MDSNIIKQFGQAITGKRTKMRTKLIIFVFFLAVSTTLWYLNKLSYEYSTNLTFPLRFENLPRGKVIIGEPPRTITLGVRAFGYTLFRYRIASTLLPITINLAHLPLVQLNDSETKYYFLTARARSSIINQLKGEFRLEQIFPDTLYFEFTSLAEKKVRVDPNISYTFERQFMMSDSLSLSPDSITISGPQTLIDTINSVATSHLRLDRIKATQNISLKIQEINQVGFSHRRVNLTIPVEKFTEANFSKTIEVKNLPDTLSLILIPRRVNVRCNVTVTRYRAIKDNSIDFYVDFRDVTQTGYNQLRVRMSDIPFYVGHIDFEPKFVEFIIEKP